MMQGKLNSFDRIGRAISMLVRARRMGMPILSWGSDAARAQGGVGARRTSRASRSLGAAVASQAFTPYKRRRDALANGAQVHHFAAVLEDAVRASARRPTGGFRLGCGVVAGRLRRRHDVDVHRARRRPRPVRPLTRSSMSHPRLSNSPLTVEHVGLGSW